jgi:hypothetical protein
MADRSLTAANTRERRTEDQARLLKWLEDELAQPAPATPPAPAAAPPAAPTSVLAGITAEPGAMVQRDIGVVKAGAAAWWDTFQTGTQNIADAIYGKAPQAWGDKIGQGTLGALQLFGTLGAGVGAAVRQAYKDYAPGKEGEVALPGGPNSPAAYLRTMFAAPALLLDPKMKAADPRALEAGLNEPVTYGELIDIITQFGVPAGVGAKVAGRGLQALRGQAAGRAATVPGPAVVPGAAAAAPPTPRAPDVSLTQAGAGIAQPGTVPAPAPPLPRTMGELMAQKGVPEAAGAKPAAAPPIAPGAPAPPRTMQDLMAEKGVPGAGPAATAAPPEVARPMTSGEVAAELRTQFERRPYEDPPSLIEGITRDETGGLIDQFGRPVDPVVGSALDERARLRAFERTPFDVARRTLAREGEAPPAVPEGALPSALEVGAARTGGPIPVITKAIEDTRTIIDEELARAEVEPAARAAEGDLPERTLDTMTEAIALTSPSGQMSARARAAAEERLRQSLFGKEGLQPEAVAQPTEQVALLRQAQELRDLADRGMSPVKHRRMADELEARAKALEPAVAPEAPTPPAAQRGAVDVGLLARMALGAAAGGAAGETPEERIMGAFAGLGLGAALNRRLAQRIVEGYKASGLADETGAIDLSKFTLRRPAVQAGEQPYQPNYARLVLTPELKHFSVKLHRLMKEETLARAGGVKSHDVTVERAHTLIRDGDVTLERLLDLPEDAMLTREEMTAGRLIGLRVREYAHKIHEGYKAGLIPDQELVDAVAVAGAISTNVRVAQKRVAQAQEASKIRLEFERPSYFRPEDIMRVANDIASNATAKQISQALDTIETPVAKQKAIELGALLPRAFLEVMYFMQLSGEAIPRNAIGVHIMPFEAMGRMALAPYLPRWGKGAGASPGEWPQVLPGTATQMWTAYQESVVDMFRMLRFWDPEARARLRTLEEEMGGGRQIEARQQAITSENFGGGLAVDWLGRVFSIPSRILGTTDATGKMLNARMWHRAEAYHQAAREGHLGADLTTRINELMQHPEQLSATSRERIQDFAERQTLTKNFDPQSLLGAVQRGWGTPWLDALWRWQVLPYYRTPARGLEATLERTPLLAFALDKTREDWGKSGFDRQIAESKMAFGVAAMGLFAYLESNAWITGDAPDDLNLAAQWEKELKWQRRSWWDPVADKWRSYEGLAPLSDLIAAGANMSAAGRRTAGDLTAMLSAGAVAIAGSLDTKQYTRTLSEWLSVMREGTTDDSKIEKFIALERRKLAGLVQPGILREIETGVDPAIRRARPSGAYGEGGIGSSLARELDVLVREWMSTIPGLSTIKDTEGRFLVPPDRDRIDGQPTMIETWPMIPFRSSTPTQDPLKLHLFGDLQGAGFAPFPEWIGGGRPVAEVGIGTRQEENVSAGVRMTPQEKDEYARQLTQVVRDPLGQTYRQALEAAVADPLYQEQATIGPSGTPRDGEKAQWLKRIDRDFHRWAEQAVLALSGPKGALTQEVERKQRERLLRPVPPAQKPAVREQLRTVPLGAGPQVAR